MKKIFSFLTLMPVLSFGQTNINLNLGFGAHYSKENTSAMLKLSAGVQINRLHIEAAEYPAISRSIEPGALLGGTVGYEVVDNLTPVAGMFYKLKSTDLKQMNGVVYAGGMRWRRFMNDNAAIFAEGLYITNSNIIAAFGITYQL